MTGTTSPIFYIFRRIGLSVKRSSVVRGEETSVIPKQSEHLMRLSFSSVSNSVVGEAVTRNAIANRERDFPNEIGGAGKILLTFYVSELDHRVRNYERKVKNFWIILSFIKF